MLDLDELIYTVTVLAAVIGLHSLFLLARSQVSILIRVVYPILYTICIILAVHTFVNIRGYALPEPPKVEFEFVHYEQAGDIIVLWVYEKDTKKDRLHHIPNTQKNRDELEEAKQAKEQGKQVTLEVKESRGTEGENDIDYVVEAVETADVEKTDPKAFRPLNRDFRVNNQL